MDTLLTNMSQIDAIRPQDILINQPENKEFRVLQIRRELVKVSYEGRVNYLRVLDIENLICGEWLVKDKSVSPD